MFPGGCPAPSRVCTHVQSKLKFHGDFEDDINAQLPSIEKLKTDADDLLERQQFDQTARQLIETKRNATAATWDLLQERTAAKKASLQHAVEFHDFNRENEEGLAWIAENLQVASSTDAGDDVERAEALLKKFTQYKQSVRAGEHKLLDDQARLAAKLISSAHPWRDEINKLQTATEQAWTNLHAQIHARHRQLVQAEEIHKLNRNVDETIFRIGEKDKVLSKQGGVQDLGQVEQLRRRHARLETDLGALQDRIVELEEQADNLTSELGGDAPAVPITVSQLRPVWEEVKAKADVTSASLALKHSKAEFLAEWDRFFRWIEDIEEDMAKDDTVADSGTAVQLEHAVAKVQQHDGLNAEIEARVNTFENLKTTGQALVDQGLDDVQEHIDTLVTAQQQLLETWAERKAALEENKQLCTFMRNAHRVAKWIDDGRSVLEIATTVEGDPVETIDGDLKKHEHFQKSVVSDS